jgi:hypothetical protein
MFFETIQLVYWLGQGGTNFPQSRTSKF